MAHIIEGIIIKKIDYKETSKIVYLITKQGKRSVVIKGAKRIKSKYLGLSQVITKVNLNVSKDDEISNIIDGDIINYYDNIKKDLDALNVCYVILENIYYLAGDDTDYNTLYDFINIILDYLNEGKNPLDVLVSFLVKALYLYGVNPKFTECVICGSKENLVFFDSYHGGVICENCIQEAKVKTSYDIMVKLIEIYFLKPQLGIIQNQKEDNLLMIKVLNDFYEYHLGYKSKSMKILNKML